jgi:Zn finger protein HypA/HybF involved in hydrogenase expression
MEMAFLCKKVSNGLGIGAGKADVKCKKAFRKDMTAYEEADEYCPHCDNQYVSWQTLLEAQTNAI